MGICPEGQREEPQRAQGWFKLRWQRYHKGVWIFQGLLSRSPGKFYLIYPWSGYLLLVTMTGIKGQAKSAVPMRAYTESYQQAVTSVSFVDQGKTHDSIQDHSR